MSRAESSALSLPVAVVADAHLGGPGGDGRELISQLETLTPANCGLLLLMGDLFHVWVGYARFETCEIRRLVRVLEGLHAKGVRSVYIEGNRDFFLGDGPYTRLFDAVVGSYDFTLGETRYLAVHGDGLNDNDWRYRFWRRLSKHRVSRFCCRRMPRGLAHRLVHSTEERLSRTNFKHKKRLPEEKIRSFATRSLGDEHDVLLLGHFHVDKSWQVAEGTVRIFDAWYNQRRLIWLSP